MTFLHTLTRFFLRNPARTGMEEERLFPIDIHYNKLLGKGSTSTLIITQLDLSVLLQRGDSLNIHAHVMRMLT